MPHWHNQPWQRNLSKTASGKTGAVHDAFLSAMLYQGDAYLILGRMQNGACSRRGEYRALLCI